jgi:uncharacterized zinc-type alcohol dehydrogenase-like protein
VTVFTTNPGKAGDAERLGAAHVIVSTDDDAMAAARGSLDVILDTVAVPHELAPYLRALDLDGTLFSLGYLGPVTVETIDLLVGRKRLASAGSGGRRSTQELLDFCGEHGIVADVEVLASREVGTALERLAKGDVRYRFVLDLAGLDDQAAGPVQ